MNKNKNKYVKKNKVFLGVGGMCFPTIDGMFSISFQINDQTKHKNA